MIRQYRLAHGGWVKFDWEKDIQSVEPNYENTWVTLKNGAGYLLEGRQYGV